MTNRKDMVTKATIFLAWPFVAFVIWIVCALVLVVVWPMFIFGKVKRKPDGSFLSVRFDQ